MPASRYLVTGGAGFIGSNLVSALVRRGDSVRALDNLATGRWELARRLGLGASDFEAVTGDLRDPATLGAALRGVEVVFHEAALGSVPRSVDDPIETNDVNVGGTVSLLDAARREGVRRVVFAASSSVYGETPVLPKHEAQVTRPMSPYAVSKLAGEHYLRVFSEVYGLETLSLRYFNVFGPNQLPDGPYAAAIPRFVDAALSNRPIRIFGDGQQTRDFCFVDNAVRANLLAADTEARLSGDVLNIAGGRRTTLNDLIARLGDLLGRGLAVEHVAARPGDVRHSLADVTGARTLIGYEPQVTWEAGLPPTIEFLRHLRTHGLS